VTDNKCDTAILQVVVQPNTTLSAAAIWLCLVRLEPMCYAADASGAVFCWTSLSGVVIKTQDKTKSL